MGVSEDEKEILDFLRSEQDAYYRSDFDAFVKHWHQGPETTRILTGPLVGTRIHRGWDELGPAFKEGMARYPQDFDNRSIIENRNVHIQISGDMAWIRYDQIARNRPKGMQLPSFAHGLKIVQRFDGAWKLVCLIDIATGIGREDVPQIELDLEGRVLGMNDLARASLPDHAGLILSGGTLRARQRKCAQALADEIARRKTELATNLPPGFLSDLVKMVPLGEDENGSPLFCWVVAERERIQITFDDDLLLQQKLEKAAEMFALSPGQVALAARLASGMDLPAAADYLGVTVNTLRTQLRRMFEKTNTHSQTELISMLLSVQQPSHLMF